MLSQSIAVCIIATRNYKRFVPALIRSITRYFLTNHKVEIHLFTDQQTRNNAIHHIIPSYGFPDATLLRYEVMTSITYDTDYVFYIDSDMRIVDYVGDEILGDLVAVRHPGYFAKGGWGSMNVDPKSLAYINHEELSKNKYYAGGFQGGRTHRFNSAMLCMRWCIEADKEKGIIAEWHDESHWNKYLSGSIHIHELNPSFCMPQSPNKRSSWGLAHLKPKILALEKDFKLMRA